MKKIAFYSVLTILFFTSCSVDGESTVVANVDGNDIPTVYQPIKIANNWNYDTESIGVLPESPAINGSDKLLVDSDVTLNSIMYKKMKTELTPTGFYGTMMNNNTIRIDGSSLKLTGSIAVNLDAALPLEFNVTDFVIFKENGVVNEVLSETSPQTFSFSDPTILNGQPINVLYTLKSTFIENVANKTVKGVSYTDVKKVKIAINAKIFTFLSNVEFVFLAPQNIIISDHYYAKNIGVIESNTVVSYAVDTSVPLIVTAVENAGIPLIGRQDINDYLINYFIGQ